MPKGSKPAGNVTMTNLTGQKQEPYLEQIWQGAQGLYDKYTPGSLTADQGIPWQQSGLQLQGDTARMVQQEWQPRVYEPWLSTAGQKYTDSPAYSSYQNAAQPGQGWYATSPQQQLADLAQAGFNGGRYGSESIRGWASQLGANNNLGLSTVGQIAQGQGAGMQQLGQAASGAYLGGNPYFASMVQNALDPITRNYQTAIAPQLDSNFAASGRYGSGAMVGQRENARNQLADQLAKTSSNMYGQNYANERQQQDAAANQYAGLQNQAGSQYGSLWNQGLAGAGQLEKASSDQYMNSLSQGANMAAQRANIQNAAAAGLQSGYNAGNQNAISAAGLYPQLAAASFLPSQQVRDVGAGVNQLQQQYIDEPYKALQLYQQAIGNPIGAGTSQPYFQNQGANIMSGITGGLDIMSKLGGMGAMAGGWIVCTELVRQGRMPKRYWAVGSCVFMQYPEVGKRGYHFWGIPLVRHLRRKPYSLLSRAACAAFNWRAEDLAARRGVRGARRRLRGRLVTWVLYPICMALGTLLPEQNWQQVYDADPRTAG